MWKMTTGIRFFVRQCTLSLALLDSDILSNIFLAVLCSSGCVESSHSFDGTCSLRQRCKPFWSEAALYITFLPWLYSFTFQSNSIYMCHRGMLSGLCQGSHLKWGYTFTHNPCCLFLMHYSNLFSIVFPWIFIIL